MMKRFNVLNRKEGLKIFMLAIQITVVLLLFFLQNCYLKSFNILETVEKEESFQDYSFNFRDYDFSEIENYKRDPTGKFFTLDYLQEGISKELLKKGAVKKYFYDSNKFHIEIHLFQTFTEQQIKDYKIQPDVGFNFVLFSFTMGIIPLKLPLSFNFRIEEYENKVLIKKYEFIQKHLLYFGIGSFFVWAFTDDKMEEEFFLPITRKIAVELRRGKK
jgi:hypothetical protein